MQASPAASLNRTRLLKALYTRRRRDRCRYSARSSELISSTVGAARISCTGRRQEQRVPQVDDIRGAIDPLHGRAAPSTVPGRRTDCRRGSAAPGEVASGVAGGVGAQAEDLDVDAEPAPRIRLRPDLPDHPILDERVPMTDVGDPHADGLAWMATCNVSAAAGRRVNATNGSWFGNMGSSPTKISVRNRRRVDWQTLQETALDPEHPHPFLSRAANTVTAVSSQPRRIVVVHSRYLSGHASGENRVVEDEIELLREAGCDVSTVVREVEPDRSRIALAADVVWGKGQSGISRTRSELLSFHRLLNTQAGVTLFLAVSRFGRARHIAAGFPPAAIRVRLRLRGGRTRPHESGGVFSLSGTSLAGEGGSRAARRLAGGFWSRGGGRRARAGGALLRRARGCGVPWSPRSFGGAVPPRRRARSRRSVGVLRGVAASDPRGVGLRRSRACERHRRPSGARGRRRQRFPRGSWRCGLLAGGRASAARSRRVPTARQRCARVVERALQPRSGG